jgi:phospholipid N-methyltransferase
MSENMDHLLVDRIRFFYSFLRSPRRVGSITPSSRFLAQAMLKDVDWANTRTIVELGAGTGVFTGLIASCKHPDSLAIVFEQDTALRRLLMRKIPGLVYRSNARDLEAVLLEQRVGQVDVIISGLPFANFSPAFRQELVGIVERSLRPGGMFVTFQYSLQMKPLLTSRFKQVNVSFVPLNLPPAFVYRCIK